MVLALALLAAAGVEGMGRESLRPDGRCRPLRGGRGRERRGAFRNRARRRDEDVKRRPAGALREEIAGRPERFRWRRELGCLRAKGFRTGREVS